MWYWEIHENQTCCCTFQHLRVELHCFTQCTKTSCHLQKGLGAKGSWKIKQRILTHSLYSIYEVLLGYVGITPARKERVQPQLHESLWCECNPPANHVVGTFGFRSFRFQFTASGHFVVHSCLGFKGPKALVTTGEQLLFQGNSHLVFPNDYILPSETKQRCHNSRRLHCAASTGLWEFCQVKHCKMIELFSIDIAAHLSRIQKAWGQHGYTFGPKWFVGYVWPPVAISGAM